MKALKIILIVTALTAAILALALLIKPKYSELDVPDFTNPIANDWKAKINTLCSDNNWNDKGYIAIETGMKADREMDNLTYGEEKSLNEYLFAFSCLYIDTLTDKLFKKPTYPESKINIIQSALVLLQGKLPQGESNSHLKNASALLGAYNRIMSLINPFKPAHYSKPFKPFPKQSAESCRREILSIPYYKSHFINNPTIMQAVNNIDKKMAEAEKKYYNDLELLIEQHHKSTKDKMELYKDEIAFQHLLEEAGISYNNAALKRLENYTRNTK